MDCQWSYLSADRNFLQYRRIFPTQCFREVLLCGTITHSKGSSSQGGQVLCRCPLHPCGRSSFQCGAQWLRCPWACLLRRRIFMSSRLDRAPSSLGQGGLEVCPFPSEANSNLASLIVQASSSANSNGVVTGQIAGTIAHKGGALTKRCLDAVARPAASHLRLLVFDKFVNLHLPILWI